MGTSLSGPLPEKRAKILPSPLERIMIYVRQETEEAYTPLHLVSILILIRHLLVRILVEIQNSLNLV